MASRDHDLVARSALEALQAELVSEHQFHPANRRRQMRARVKKASNFPHNTCGASRHLKLMADELSTVGYYHMLSEEPLHCATNLYAVVAALWEARTELAALKSSAEQTEDRLPG